MLVVTDAAWLMESSLMGLEDSLLLTFSPLSTALQPRERKREKGTDWENIEPEEGEGGKSKI